MHKYLQENLHFHLKKEYLIILLVFFVTFANFTVLPKILSEELNAGIDSYLVGILLSIGSFSAAISSIPIGIYLDKNPVGRMLSIGLLLRTLPFFILIMTQGYIASLFCIFLLGVLSPFISLGGYLWISRTVENNKGKILGIFTAAFNAGTIGGPIVGGYISDCVGFSKCCFFLAITHILFIPFFFNMSDSSHNLSVSIKKSISTHKNTLVKLIFLAILINTISAFYGPYWAVLANRAGATEHNIRVIMAVLGAVITLGAIIAGWLSDRVGTVKVIYCGLLGLMLVLPFIPLSSFLFMLVGLYSIAKLVESLTCTGTTVLFLKLPKDFRGTFYSLSIFVSWSFYMISVVVSGIILDRQGVNSVFVITEFLIIILIIYFKYVNSILKKIDIIN
nr:hypothetical protein, major facilitator superfamily [uncultured archaeon]